MIKLFFWRKLKTFICPVVHFKKAGEPFDKRLKPICEIAHNEKTSPTYTCNLYECQVCHTRALGCIGGHSFNQYVCEIIDSWCAHKITTSNLIYELRDAGYLVKHLEGDEL